ncbi:MAG: CBS domain-containing protein, partial [Desulfobacula sp.]|nr:CBS domain-containing protein [Desulfobacula sp.]
LCQKWTIFENQVKSRVDSPAHAGEFMMDILQTMKISDLRHLIKEVRCVNEDMPFSEFKKIFSSTKQHYFPVINNSGDLSGIFSSNDVREIIFTQHIEQLVVMKDIIISDLICTTPFEDLNTVLHKLTQKNIDALPVMEEEGSHNLIGLIYRRDIISHYNQHIKQIKAHE